jgi:predicted PurR-regulated permease PerM
LKGDGIEADLRNRAASLVAMGAVIALLYWARAVFITLITAMVIAFILEPFVGLLMRVRFPRAVASIVVCSLALFAVYLMGLGAYTQMAVLADDLPNYTRRIGEIVEATRKKMDDSEKAVSRVILPQKQIAQQQVQEQAAQAKKSRKKAADAAAPAVTGPAPIQEVRIHSDANPVMDYIYDKASGLYQVVLMGSFIPFLVYFMLSWRDHVHRSFLQFFKGEDRVVAAKSLQGIGEMVRGFVVGNFVLGLILAVVSSAAFWKFGVPYPMLVGPLSGFLSLVPYVGLPVAMIPPLLVSLTAHSELSFYVLVIAAVTVFHVLAMNMLYPKIVGSRVHLNPLVVTIALMVWGFLWDAAGLVLAIPLTAGIKAVCDNVRELRPYGKFLGD